MLFGSQPFASGPLADDGGVTHALAANLTGTGTRTGGVSLTVKLDGTLSATGTLTASVSNRHSVSATLVGRGTVTASALSYTGYLATMYAYGTVSASIRLRYAVSATVAATGAVNASLVRIGSLTATTVAATGNVTANAVLIRKVNCGLVGRGALRVQSGTDAEAVLSATSTVFGSASKIYAEPIKAGSGLFHFPSVLNQTLKSI